MNLISPIYIIFIYGSPDKSKRKALWNDLEDALPKDQYPCIVMGDFNAILSPLDKKSIYVNGKRCNLFGNFVESCNL